MKLKKACPPCFKHSFCRRGMTYVELIVVLSIFSIMSAIALFDYGKFQARTDIRNLTSDIALQIVEAQKNAMAGKLPIGIYSTSAEWKPAHGVHFDLTDSTSFKYFVDTNSSNTYNPVSDSINCQTDGECLDRIDITKGNKITELKVSGGSCGSAINSLDIVFRRPNSSALVSIDDAFCGSFSEAVIRVSSPEEIGAEIHVYPSGRIEIK